MRNFVLLFLLGISTSCNKPDEGKASNRIVGSANVPVFGSQIEFPPCDAGNAKTIVFSEADNAFFICDGTQYKITNVGQSTDAGEVAQASGISLNCPGAVEKTPDPEGVFGQFQVNVPEDVDPCSLKGYVVGQQGNLSIGTAKDGTYYFNNVPPGSNDLMITAGTIAIGGLSLSAAPEDRGIRLNNAQSITGLVTKLGKINLPKNGSLSGKATLKSEASQDHAGILVYIPGTSYSALTDKDGNFKIEKVPSGTHNLFIEKDGFARGQIEALVVQPEEDTVIEEVGLYLDTGEYGSFSILNSFKHGSNTIVAGLDISLAMLPSAGATLMMVAFTDDEGRWMPVTTNHYLTRNIDSMLEKWNQWGSTSTTMSSPLYAGIKAKFANANGLESDTITKNLQIDYFSDGTKVFSPEFDMALKTNPLRVEIKNIKHPAKGEKISVNVGTTNYVSSPVFEPLFTARDYPIKDQIKNCGDISGLIYYSGLGGKILSSIPYDQTSTMKVTNSCFAMTPMTDSIEPPSGNYKQDQIFSAWNGTDLFIFGYNDDNDFTGSSYTPSSNAWGASIDSTNAPSFRKSPQVMLSADLIFVFGGFDGNNNHLVSLGVFDPATRTWKSPATNAPDFSVHGGRLVTTETTLYYILPRNEYNGATFQHEYWMDIYTYDGIGNTWSSAVPMNGIPFRYDLVAQKYGSQILVAGGRDKDYVDSLEVFAYNPGTDTTTPMANLPTAITAYWASDIFYDTENGDIYLAKSYTTTVFKYTTSSTSWTSHTIKKPLYNPRTVLRTGNELAFIDWGSEVTILNLSNQESIGSFVGANFQWDDPTIRRWSMQSTHLEIAPIKGYGLFVWGGDYSYYEPNASQATVVTATDGAIIKTNFSDSWN